MSSEKPISIAIGAIPVYHTNNGFFLAINCLKTSTPKNQDSTIPLGSCFLMTSPVELLIPKGNAKDCPELTGPIRCLVTKANPSRGIPVIVKEIFSSHGIIELYTESYPCHDIKHQCILFLDKGISRYKSVCPDSQICFISLEHNSVRISLDFENWTYLNSELIKAWGYASSEKGYDMADLGNSCYLLITRPVQNLLNHLIHFARGATFFSQTFTLKEYIMQRLE